MILMMIVMIAHIKLHFKLNWYIWSITSSTMVGWYHSICSL
jgi:hypothetical protein